MRLFYDWDDYYLEEEDKETYNLCRTSTRGSSRACRVQTIKKEI